MSEEAAAVNEALNASEALNETAKNATKFIASSEGMVLAYGSLAIMAFVPIFIGSLWSVKFQKKQKENDETPERMTSKDAAMFPLIASCALFGIYLVFRFFSKEYINMLLTVYFFVLGVLALTHIVTPLIHKLLPNIFPNQDYHLILTEGTGANKIDIMNYEFDRKDLFCLAASSVVGVWYLVKKHWVANNIFGLAFSVNAIEILQLNSVKNGCILLGGLFIYDIFWVFGTDVMVTVAKSFEAPIKLVFPQDLLEAGLGAKHFAMLGLGDIVIPGIFIALLLRFDTSLGRGKKTYFYSGFFAYILGLALTMIVMHVFKHAQPALLYLVPCCLFIPVVLALVSGDVKAMFAYEDNTEEEMQQLAERQKLKAEGATNGGDDGDDGDSEGGDEEEEEGGSYTPPQTRRRVKKVN